MYVCGVNKTTWYQITSSLAERNGMFNNATYAIFILKKYLT